MTQAIPIPAIKPRWNHFVLCRVVSNLLRGSILCHLSTSNFVKSVRLTLTLIITRRIFEERNSHIVREIGEHRIPHEDTLPWALFYYLFIYFFLLIIMSLKTHHANFHVRSSHQILLLYSHFGEENLFILQQT